MSLEERRSLGISTPPILRGFTDLSSFYFLDSSENWLLCARALSHAYALDSSNPDLHVQIVKFKNQGELRLLFLALLFLPVSQSRYLALFSQADAHHFASLCHLSKVADISTAPEPIREALSAAIPTFYPEESLSLEQFNSTYSQKYPNSAEHILASAKGLMEIRGGSGKEDAVQLVMQCTKEENQAPLEVSIQK